MLNPTSIIELYINQAGLCAYCRCDLLAEIYSGGSVVIEHIIPVSRGGTNERSNLCISCDECNRVKRSKTGDEYNEFLKPFHAGLVEKKELTQYHRFKRHADLQDSREKVKDTLTDSDKEVLLNRLITIENRVNSLSKAFGKLKIYLEEGYGR